MRIATAFLAPLAFFQAVTRLNYQPAPMAVYTYANGLWAAQTGGVGQVLNYTPVPTGLYCTEDGSGSVGTWAPCQLAMPNAPNTYTAPQTFMAGITGPATAPSGACSATGVWILSMDGHASFCAAGQWVTKI